MPPYLLELVQTANSEIPRFLASASAMADDPQAPMEVQKLANQLRQIGEQLAASQAGAPQNEETQAVLAEYRHNLEQLLPVLEKVRSDLFARRGQLQVEESQLLAARSWAARYRDTF